MFCPKCGKKNNDQASFCSGCGYSFAIDLAAGLNQKQAAMAPKQKHRRKKYIVASIGLAVAVVAVVIGAGIFFRSNTVDAWLPSRIEMTNSLDGDATTEIYEMEYSKNSVTVNSPTRDDSYTYEFEGDTCTVLDENGEEVWRIQASRDDCGRVTTAQSTEGEISIDYSYDDNSVIREVSLPSLAPLSIYDSSKSFFDEKGFKTGSEFLYADGVKTEDGVDLSGSKGYESMKYDYLGADENGTQYKSVLLNDDGDELATGSVVVDSNGNQVFQGRYYYSRYWEKRISYEYVQGVDQFMVALFWRGFILGGEM